jgi:hypothetical protein
MRSFTYTNWLILIQSMPFQSIAVAQDLIALHSNGKDSFFSKLDDAINTAQNGVAITILGGSYTITNPGTKNLHLIDAGYL